MNEIRSSLTKDSIIIIFILVVLLAVIFIFYSENVKNQKIKTSKNNFYIVKEELTKEVLKCGDKKLSWVFGDLCTNQPKKDIVYNYFNDTKKLVNPYDNQNGVNGTPGSVLIELKHNMFILSVDIDANGGIDIEHKIYIN